MSKAGPVHDLPGTPQHQAVLRAIIQHYDNDSRIRAILLFGSLATENWHPLSDLDLDVVVEDGTAINPRQELEQLCQSLADLGGHGALIIPDEDDGDVVLASLMEFSIRYHPLATTSPNIVDKIRLLVGRLDLETIQAAGLANRVLTQPAPTILLSQCIRWAIETDAAIQRDRLWLAIELVHYIRANLMELFTVANQAKRPLHFFDAHAHDPLPKRLSETFPSLTGQAIYGALMPMLDVLENGLDELGSNDVYLTSDQRHILACLRRRIDAREAAI